jgi:hypothetical protein
MFPSDRLHWHREKIYFQHSELKNMGLWSLPAAGGPARRLTDQSAWRFWVEDEHVLFPRDDGLYGVPLEGGPLELVLAAQLYPRLQPPLAQALDREGFYSVVESYEGGLKGGWTLNKQPRDGGPPVVLARTSNEKDFMIRDLYPAADQVVVVPYSQTTLWAVPKTGGEARPLPGFGGLPGLLGVSEDGTLLWRKDAGTFNGTRESDQYLVGRSRLDGAAPERFWTGKPPTTYPMAAWGDGAGGWYVAAWERLIDEALHVTIWSVDRDGRGIRLACDPEVESTARIAAVGPDGVYPLVRQSNNYWVIARIPRIQPGP